MPARHLACLPAGRLGGNTKLEDLQDFWILFFLR
jgi:hypothetical protein